MDSKILILICVIALVCIVVVTVQSGLPQWAIKAYYAHGIVG